MCGTHRLALGIVTAGWLRTSRPDAMARIGSVLGEEGGTDAKLLDR